MVVPFSAPCLRVLLAEVNARWPGRDRTSDGWLGDAAHAARASDHNPDLDGSVDAIDVDKDGIDVDALIGAVWGDPRVSYVIHAKRWAGVATGWRWRTYTGSNPHNGHVHISSLESGQNDTRPWGIAAARVSNPGASVPTAPASTPSAQTLTALAPLATEADMLLITYGGTTHLVTPLSIQPASPVAAAVIQTATGRAPIEVDANGWSQLVAQVQACIVDTRKNLGLQ